MRDLPIAGRVVWPASFLLAVAAHAALLLFWLWHDPDALAGAGGQEPDVISFILADPGVLETREVNLAVPAVPAPADAVEEKEGSAEENAPKKQETKEVPEPREPEDEMRKPDAVLEKAKPKPPDKSRPEDNSVKGGAAARGKAATETKPRAPAAASAGSIREYAKSVSQALVRTKPKGIGAQGIIKVRFTIAISGRLSSVQIVSSSGDKKLDQKVIDAVRHAVFPAPPAGMTVTQLTYEIPINFADRPFGYSSSSYRLASRKNLLA